jgi:hypothetical protein
MRARFSTVVRRRASVGCAVMTSRSSAPASISRSSAAVVPRSARCMTAARIEPARGAPPPAPLAPAQAADALVVLGEVDELEPARERAHQHLGVIEREGGDELFERARGGVVACPRALSERGRALVERDRVLALARRQHGAEELEQERPVVDERAPAEIAEWRGSAGGFGGHRLER